MKTLLMVFVEQAYALKNKDLDTAIACVCNALCVRSLNPFNRRELYLILAEMQKEQRAKWRRGER